MDEQALTRNDRIQAIKKLINDRPNEVIKVADFKEVAGAIAPVYLKELLAKGHMERIVIKNGEKGSQYSYVWHDEPMAGQRLLDNEEVDRIATALNDWILNGIGDDVDDPAQMQHGAIEFVKWLRNSRK